jgi:hypothetical protein
MLSQRFSAQQTLQLVMMDQMTAEREKQINQVAESVNDLADIFKEIQVGGGAHMRIEVSA